MRISDWSSDVCSSDLGSIEVIDSPARMPEVGKIVDIREPVVKVTLFMPQEYVGPVMTLCNNKRGIQINMRYHGRQVHLTYAIPLGEKIGRESSRERVCQYVEI